MNTIASLHGAGYRLVLRKPLSGKRSAALADLFGPDGKINPDDTPVELEFEETKFGLALVVDIKLANLILDMFIPVRVGNRTPIEELREAPVRIYSRTADAAQPPDPGMQERLGKLGDALLTPSDVAVPSMAQTPAAYTYFGQFLAHELTVWKEIDRPDSGAKVCILDSAIDLKTIFLRPFGFPAKLPVHVEEKEGLALGTTYPDSGEKLFGHGLDDLPRLPSGEALLFEKRNDQNLAISQTHVAVTRFVQAALRILAQDGSNDDDARRTVLRHFQSVVLQDYLPRLVDPATWADVMENGRVVVAPSRSWASECPFFAPSEFFGAIFKFGHTMRRDVYKPWNTINPDHTVQSANSTQLLELTYAGGALAQFEERVPQSWVTDWRHMLGFKGIKPIKAHRLGTALSKHLFCLPEYLFQHSKHDRICPESDADDINLARRTLLVGADLQLPSGQVYAGTVQAKLAAAGSPSKIRVLTPEELKIPGNAAATAIMEQGTVGQRFVDQTPLWLYTLREAAVLGGGNHLGPLGGRILAETMSAAVEASGTGMIVNGIRQPFAPDPRFGGDSLDKFDLKDLIRLAFDDEFLKAT